MKLEKFTGKYNKAGKPIYKKCDFPEFMKYTKEVKHTRDGKELPYEEVAASKNKLKSRINHDLQCPMNWLEEWLDKIQGASTSDTNPTAEFFIKMNGKPNNRQMSKIRALVENYDLFVKALYISDDDEEVIIEKIICESNNLANELSKIKIGNIVTINRLIETALGLETGVGASKKMVGISTKYTRKMLNILYKMDKDKFLINFKSV